MKAFLGVGIAVIFLTSLSGSEHLQKVRFKTSAEVSIEKLEKGCREGNVEFVKGILKRVPWLDVNRPSRVPALIEILTGKGSSHNKIELIQELRKHKVNAEKEYKGMCAIHWAIMSRCEAAVIEELLSGSCSSNSMTIHGLSALTLAVLKRVVPEGEEVPFAVLKVLMNHNARFKSPVVSVSRDVLLDLIDEPEVAVFLGEKKISAFSNCECLSVVDKEFSFFSESIKSVSHLTSKKSLLDSEECIELRGAYLCHLDLFKSMQRENGE